MDVYEKLIVLRIGDTLSDKFLIPKEIKDRVVKVEKFCTKPEFEILLIINEGMFDEYNKTKSSIKCKTFAKMNITFNGKKYNQTSKWLKDYLSCHDISRCLKEYKRIHKKAHKKDEFFVYDLIKGS